MLFRSAHSSNSILWAAAVSPDRKRRRVAAVRAVEQPTVLFEFHHGRDLDPSIRPRKRSRNALILFEIRGSRSQCLDRIAGSYLDPDVSFPKFFFDFLFFRFGSSAILGLLILDPSLSLSFIFIVNI